MGITQKSLDRLNRYNCLQSGVSMLELGAQNLYDNQHYGKIAKDVFQAMGIKHYSVDIIPHQGAIEGDLREDWQKNCEYYCVTNFGTLEHVDGSLYQPLKNIHEACCVGGLMVHENPKFGNWPGHGQHYFTKEFWVELTKECKYDVLEVTEESAMSNTTDGWNVCAVLRKSAESTFPTKAEFDKIYKKHIKPS